MKVKSVSKIIISFLLIAAMTAAFCACGTAVSVSVRDGEQTTSVETKTGKKIADILADAEITLGEKDKTEPALDAKLTKDVTEIVIKRYAKVTVIKGKDSKEVELVGGTVQEALKQAGVTLAENESPDVEMSAFLTNGMTITVAKANTVTLVHDGKTDTVTTKAATVGDLLKEQKLTLGDDDEISAKTDVKLKDGAKIVIKRITYKTQTKTETVAYTSSQEYTSSLASGQTQVKQSGQNGEKEVTYKVKFADGKQESETVISEKITKQAVNEIVLVGTASNNTSNNSEAGGKTVVSKTPTYNCDDQTHGYWTIVYSDGSVEYEEF